MVQQGRLVAAALGDRERVLPDEAQRSCRGWDAAATRGIRVYDAAGVLLADSVRAPDLGDPGAAARTQAASGYSQASGVRERLLYRRRCVARRRQPGDWGRCARDRCRPARARASLERRPREITTPGPEVRAALEGRYGTDVRPTPGQRSLTLYSAVPIRHGDRVVGVALVSQSTFRILQALYEVRLRIFQIVVASFAAAVAHRAAHVGDDRAAARPPAPRGARAVGSPGDTGRLWPASIARTRSATWRGRSKSSPAGSSAHQAARIVRGRRIARVQEPAGVDSRCRRGHRFDRRSRRAAASADDADARRRSARAAGLRRSRAGANRRAARARGGGAGRRGGPARRAGQRIPAARSTRPVREQRPAVGRLRSCVARSPRASRREPARQCGELRAGRLLRRSARSRPRARRVSSASRTAGLVFLPGMSSASSIASSPTVPKMAAAASTWGWACRLPARLSRVTAALFAVSNRQGGGASVEVRLPLVSGVQPSSRHVQIVSDTGFVSKG